MLRQQLRNAESSVEAGKRAMEHRSESEREEAGSREAALRVTLEEMKAAHEKEVSALRDELSSNGEWWRSRVDAVREEEEAVS